MFGDLRLYDKDFKLISILPEYLGVNWEIKFAEIGSGEIELKKSDEIVELLQKNKYMFIFQDDLQAIVTGYKIGETVTVFLRTLEWFMAKYVVEKFKIQDLNMPEGTTKWTVSSLVFYILKTYMHSDFNIEFCGIENDESDLSDFISENSESVYSLVKKIISDNKYGFRFFWDDDKERFEFSVVSPTENNDLILCDEYKTTYDSEYTFDIQQEISGGIYYQSVKNMGRWDAENNEPPLCRTEDNYAKYYTVSSDGDCFGVSVKKGDIILCKEKSGEFCVVDDAEPFLVKIEPEENGIYSFSGVLNSREESGAKEELKENKAIDMLTCKTRLQYKKDFNLGDIVTVKLFTGDESIEKKKLIKEIHLWDEPDDTGAMPTMEDIE